MPRFAMIGHAPQRARLPAHLRSCLRWLWHFSCSDLLGHDSVRDHIAMASRAGSGQCALGRQVLQGFQVSSLGPGCPVRNGASSALLTKSSLC